MNKKTKTFCGFAGIIGKPNVGKSTLLNALIGKKISITSRKPQTTRHKILGILTESPYQIIFCDTPGIHQKKQHQLNEVIVKTALHTMREVDVIIFMIEAQSFTEQDMWILERIAKLKLPVIVALNKVDQIKNKDELLPHLLQLEKQLTTLAIKDFVIIPISAKLQKQLPKLTDEIKKHLPESPFLFPEEQYTDKNTSFLITEIIREKLMRYLGQEVPHHLTVTLEAVKDKEKVLVIHAVIWVAKQGQKSIVIGEHGKMLKTIGEKARLDLQKQFNKKIFLELWVKVKDKWYDDNKLLKQFGYEIE